MALEISVESDETEKLDKARRSDWEGSEIFENFLMPMSLDMRYRVLVAHYIHLLIIQPCTSHGRFTLSTLKFYVSFLQSTKENSVHIQHPFVFAR